MSKTIDTQRLAISRAEFVAVTSQSLVSVMNHGLYKPHKLLFFKDCQNIATFNDTGYNQSHLLLTDKAPSGDTVAQKTSILLLAVPLGVNYLDI